MTKYFVSFYFKYNVDGKSGISFGNTILEAIVPYSNIGDIGLAQSVIAEHVASENPGLENISVTILTFQKMD